MTGEQLKAWRKSEGITQSEIAAELNSALGTKSYTKVLMSYIENGIVDLPENAVLYINSKIAEKPVRTGSDERNEGNKATMPLGEIKSLKSAILKRRRRMNIKTLEQEVREILTDNPKARDSNEYLYGIYLAKHGISIQSVNSFFMGFAKYDVSSFESVTRARRKIVEHDPSLGASEEVKQMRLERQYGMFDYAKGNM